MQGVGGPSISAGVQAPGPPVGSVVVITRPVPSTAAQNDADGHATEPRPRPLSIVVLVQTPAVGSVEMSSAPPAPTAMQSDAAGQATLARLSDVGVGVHVPAAGSVVVKILGGVLLTATHSVVVGHDPDTNAEVPRLTAHALAPPVGLLELRTVPASSVTKHREACEHRTAPRLREPSMSAVDHARAPPVGFVETAMLPPTPVATHVVVDGQVTLPSPATVGRTVRVQAAAPAVGSVDVYTVEPPTATHSDGDGHATALGPFKIGGMPMIAVVHVRAPPDGSG